MFAGGVAGNQLRVLYARVVQGGAAALLGLGHVLGVPTDGVLSSGLSCA